MTGSHALMTLLMCALGSSLMTLETDRGPGKCGAWRGGGHVEWSAPTARDVASNGCGRFADGYGGGADGSCARELGRAWPARRAARRAALARLERRQADSRGRWRAAGGLAAVLALPAMDRSAILGHAAAAVAPDAWRQLQAGGQTAAARARVAAWSREAWAGAMRRMAKGRPRGALIALARRGATEALALANHAAGDFAAAAEGWLRQGRHLGDLAESLRQGRGWGAALPAFGQRGQPLSLGQTERVAGLQPGDAAAAVESATAGLRELAGESLAVVGRTMLDLSRALQTEPPRGAKPVRRDLGAQARSTCVEL